MGDHFLTILTVVLLVALAWRFCKALAWQPPDVAYKREFSRVRRDVLARDGHRCQRCGRAMRSGLHVHHIHQRQHGGSNNPANLISLCPDCHRIVHGRRF